PKGDFGIIEFVDREDRRLIIDALKTSVRAPARAVEDLRDVDSVVPTVEVFAVTHVNLDRHCIDPPTLGAGNPCRMDLAPRAGVVVPKPSCRERSLPKRCRGERPLQREVVVELVQREERVSVEAAVVTKTPPAGSGQDARSVLGFVPAQKGALHLRLEV